MSITVITFFVLPVVMFLCAENCQLFGGFLCKLTIIAPFLLLSTEELFPDLSTGRIFEVSSTCGQFGAEEFVGSCFPGGGNSLICDASDPEKAHPPEFLSDEDDPLGPPEERTWWLSENGVEEVIISLNLEGFYFLQAVQVYFLSPLPSTAVLEVSQDFGTSFHPLRYYSENCRLDFDLPDSRVTTGSDRLICTSQFSDGDESLVKRGRGGGREGMGWEGKGGGREGMGWDGMGWDGIGLSQVYHPHLSVPSVK